MKARYSLFAFIVSGLCLIYSSLVFYPKWQKQTSELAISYDVAGYYWYLPSIFIYHDLKHQSFADSLIKKYNMVPELPGYKADNGNYVLKYSSGMSLMYLPAFTAANIYARNTDKPADGFSPPYQLAIQLSGLLISIIGLWYFRKLFLIFYNDVVVAISMLLLVIGSNYIDFAAINIGMSHTWLFTLYVLLLLNTVHFYDSYRYKYVARIGFLIGLLTLARPTEIISVLIPLLWGMESISGATIKKQFVLLWQQRKKLLVAILCGAIVILVQPMYWKYVSGHWVQYSYQDQGFSWRHPHVLIYSFNYRSGWLTYAPLMIFALIGILPFIKQGRNKVAILAFILLNYYIVSAWDIWWYGGRAMIQSYPLLFFPFASFIAYVIRRKVLAVVVTPFILLFVYFNVWLTYHEHKGNMYSPDDMTRAYFRRVVGRWTVPEETLKLRDNSELFEGTPRDMKLIYQNDFENDSLNTTAYPPISGRGSLCLTPAHDKSGIYKFPLLHHTKWMRAQATFRCTIKEWTSWKMPEIIVHYYKKQEEIKNSSICIDRFLDNGVTKDLYIDTKMPQDADSAGISFQVFSDKTTLVDNLRVSTFEQ
jgi:hypothetical protein